ncbi:SDR family NAD(P)-dependent oxidoreductase [Paenibacillus sp. 1011MAR3C5]|uniref:SDR family NAD(P)-dependent oxidoreductase n=1 Tax=Paenibacillus sp. 1011MAR3C5 TaxID=1675787 RepID=UPI000E6C7515|nr:SDR family NAD(P)-dependent oxidoreductase [Paenibacillus sp. 1011MAR3C5]RJE89677.1 SDR family NAD(P)-dependent oxidoreductase [Paenibacillus sp. 1011MAR3C5]
MRSYNLLEHILFPSSRLNSDKLAYALQGKTVLITGASSGIGEHVARLLGLYQVHLVIVARRVDRLLNVKESIEESGKAKVSIVRANLRLDEDMEALLKFLHKESTGLDFVVNNAGISIKRSVRESLDRYHDYTRTITINYLAPVKLLLSVIPILERNQGQVINISTINTSLIPIPHFTAYQASKAAFDVWFRSAASELNALGIAMSSIYLPLVRTPMIEPTAAYRSMPAMSPEHVARIIAKSMYTKRTTWQPWWLFIGQTASLLFRGLWENGMSRKLRKRRGKHGNS